MKSYLIEYTMSGTSVKYIPNNISKSTTFPVQGLSISEKWWKRCKPIGRLPSKPYIRV